MSATPTILIVFSHSATPRTRPRPMLRMIRMGFTVIYRALHTAPREITTQIPIEFYIFVIGLGTDIGLGVTQCV